MTTEGLAAPGPRPYRHLLSPGRIGSLELRNRVVMCPMGVLLSNDDGSVSDTEIAFYQARARGGAGLLIVGTTCVGHPEGTNHRRMQAVSDDKYLPGIIRLTDTVHAEGARIAAQLNFMGVYSFNDMLAGRPRLVPFVPADPAPDDLTMMISEHEMTTMATAHLAPGANLDFKVADEADIARVVALYADAADRCRRGGYDGLEIHAGHGYFIDEFLSPRNTRSDRWGGDVAGRARILVEIVRAIRGRVGDAFPVWIRLNSREYHHANGETFEDQVEVARLALAAGIDAVHLTAYANVDVATAATDSYAPHVVRDLPRYAGELRRATGATVITFGRHDPAGAEEVLANGDADFVGFARRLLADPEMPRKLAEGRTAEVRPCIYQYTCLGNIALRTPVRCAVNPNTGREASRTGPVADPRRVLVVGGGPAGMETARCLAEVGHRVTLVEKDVVLGGALRHAALTDPLLVEYLDWLRRGIDAAGVEVRLGERFDIEAPLAGYDDVVLALGADWTAPGSVPATALRLPDLTGWLAEDDATTVGARVVVVGNSKAALSIAETCVARGRTTTLVSDLPYVAGELGVPGRHRRIRDYLDSGGTLITGATVHEIPSGLRIERPDGPFDQAADTVIVVRAKALDLPAVEQWRAGLESPGIRLHIVGDSGSPDGIHHAVKAVDDLVALISRTEVPA